MAGYRGGFKGNSNSKRGGFSSKKFNNRSNNNKNLKKNDNEFDREIDSEDEGPEEEGIGRFNNNEDSEDEDDFFSDDNSNNNNNKQKQQQSKKKNKHAPKETKINHRPVSVVRDIPGLVVRNRDSNLDSFNNRDIRFDTALGKSIDYEIVRKQYSFLDEYRETEIKEMEKILKDKKLLNRLDENQINDLKYKLQSTRSKLESLKKKDREKQALKDYIKENKNSNNNKFLTRAEKRKVLLVDRFEHMNSKQKTKSIERKRKRKLGKEMRALEFGRN
ncbi:rRNA biogenesis protein rrp36 [Pichia californica]|uniref:rRNA biogenesis protein RRP36 n=1 Tax=Pichia californica TaxID=460514 RepID=A0A9P6WFY5_9ASCO|nr:rRNA biogenesis protein rrp36 [[Candida] californica]KAG0686469.1 rRNA biogenesis protein rrp36 [[Candida] californica]